MNVLLIINSLYSYQKIKIFFLKNEDGEILKDVTKLDKFKENKVLN